MRLNPDIDIETATFQTAYGWVSIAWSAQGLVGLTLPQSSEVDALGQIPAPRGPRPEAPPGLDVTGFIEKVQRYFEGELVTFDEPLDPTLGTEFQRRVWAITRAIPRGWTRTYGEIAREAGSPAAARAVGQSMARNHWPVIVPCHRVLGSDGSLTGFGGGLKMKRKMLEMEGGLGLEDHQPDGT